MTRAPLAPVAAGTALPDIQFGPISRKMLALYAGASGDHNPIHIDSDFAHEAGVADVFAHGMLSYGVLARYVTDWCGIERLRHFSARFLAITQVHDVVSCRGVIQEQIELEGEICVRTSLDVTAGDGRKTLAGTAVVAVG